MTLTDRAGDLLPKEREAGFRLFRLTRRWQLRQHAPPRPIADSLVPSYWGPLSLTRPRHLWGACLNEKVRPSHFSSLSTSSRWCPSPGTLSDPPTRILPRGARACIGRARGAETVGCRAVHVRWLWARFGLGWRCARECCLLLSGQWPRWVWPVSCWPCAPPGRARSSPAPTGSHVSHT